MGAGDQAAASCLKWWSEKVIDHPIEDLLNEVDDSISPVVFLPYLLGKRTPYANSNARGTFVGMTPNTQRHELTKAVLEGVAFGLKDSLDILKDMRIEVKEIRVIGGGAKSRAWRQILADVFGQEILGINTNQGGALGAAILAAVGDGLYPSVEEAAQVMIQTLDPVSPSMDQSKVYAEKHQAYQYLYRCLEPFFEIKK